MVKVVLLGPIGGGKELKLEVKTLAQLKEILNRDPELREWLKVSAVAVNGEFVTDLNRELKPGDEVLILPPVCGG
jgi:molybdopterin synthase sulfur carrier subunit